MRSAARELDFERAAALRDEIQAIRLRVLEQDESLVVGRAAERAASSRGTGLTGAADRKRAARAGEALSELPIFEVTSVTVLPAEEEPRSDARRGSARRRRRRGRRRPEHGQRLAARHPRRARGLRARRGVARPADLGPVRDAERPPPPGEPARPSPLTRGPPRNDFRLDDLDETRAV